MADEFQGFYHQLRDHLATMWGDVEPDEEPPAGEQAVLDHLWPLIVEREAIQQAHMWEMRHAIEHAEECTGCEDCKRLLSSAAKHETWWDFIDEENDPPGVVEKAKAAREDYIVRARTRNL